ncbi:MAG: outer membrane beta-barrel protein, partial [Verrucomicrobiota bacterium]|nr:outer membrane beta-barrel protein [Verrucomicrobiota bacterium]
KGAPNLLYGQGSKAWSITVTPTYQYKIFFLRGEASYVETSKITSGLAFGSDGNSKNQTRFVVETGILF